MNNTMESINRPQSFCVENKLKSNAILKAFWNDLKLLGYKTSLGQYSMDNDILESNFLCINSNEFNSKDFNKDWFKLKNEFEIIVSCFDMKDKFFILPQQYKEALDFAKEQIEKFNQKEEFKENDIIVRTWPSGKKTLGICKFNKEHNQLLFLSLETYDKEGGVQANQFYGYLDGYNKIPYYKASFDEIQSWFTSLTRYTYIGSGNISIDLFDHIILINKTYSITFNDFMAIYNKLSNHEIKMTNVDGITYNYPYEITIKIHGCDIHVSEIKKRLDYFKDSPIYKLKNIINLTDFYKTISK